MTSPAGLLLALGRLYQRTLSYVLPTRCRFYPSCSEYFLQAVELRGAWCGLWLALWRLARCQPLCRGGYDPVPTKPAGPTATASGARQPPAPLR